MDEAINFRTPSNETAKITTDPSKSLVHFQIGIKPILSNG